MGVKRELFTNLDVTVVAMNLERYGFSIHHSRFNTSCTTLHQLHDLLYVYLVQTMLKFTKHIFLYFHVSSEFNKLILFYFNFRSKSPR